MNKIKKYEYDFQRRRPRTPGGHFAKHMGEVFAKELERMKISPHEFYRHHALLVSYPTFKRMFDGKSGANCCLIADIADALGYELRLVPKEEEEQKDNENETKD